jgi:hypothetical protein
MQRASQYARAFNTPSLTGSAPISLFVVSCILQRLQRANDELRDALTTVYEAVTPLQLTDNA